MNTKAKMMMAAAALAICAQPAFADKGDLVLRVGLGMVDPKSDNHPVVNVDSDIKPTINGTYFLTDNWAVDVLGALPFKHDINLNGGGGRVGETKHLPPTVSLQYHFMPNAPMFRPYVGVGVNATLTFDEGTTGALAGSDLSLDNSFGVAAQLGADFAINDKWAVNVDVRWADIDFDASLDGTSLGTVEVDPFVFGVSVVRKFKL
jgi:outer membrane protein